MQPFYHELMTQEDLVKHIVKLGARGKHEEHSKSKRNYRFHSFISIHFTSFCCYDLLHFNLLRSDLRDFSSLKSLDNYPHIPPTFSSDKNESRKNEFRFFRHQCEFKKKMLILIIGWTF